MEKELRQTGVEMFIAAVEKPRDSEKYDRRHVSCLDNLKLHVS